MSRLNFRYRRNSDHEPLAHVRVEHVVDPQDVLTAVLAYGGPYVKIRWVEEDNPTIENLDDIREFAQGLQRGTVDEWVRSFLWAHGSTHNDETWEQIFGEWATDPGMVDEAVAPIVQRLEELYPEWRRIR